MDSRKGLVSALTAAACLGATAATNTWVRGSALGWNDPGSWDGGVPTASSVVKVPEGTTMPVGEDDMALATTVAEIYLAESNSVVSFDFESTYTMSGLVRGNGKIVKDGGGTLNLSNTTVDGYYAREGMDVNAGVVHCPDTFGGGYSDTVMHIGPLYVAAGATFSPYAKYRITDVSKVTGGGRIQNATGGGYWPLRINTAERCVFEGKIESYLELMIYGPVDLVGEESSFMGDFVLSENADCGVKKFGYGTQTASSIGRLVWSSSRKAVNFDATACLRYLGTGENTDRDFRFAGGNEYTLDAGATGGLWLRGRFYTASERQRVLELSGSNTVESTLACAWDETGESSTYIAKKGTGTWKMVGTNDRFNKGVVAVEDGTLKFDSLAETNVPCSFGLSTRLAQKYSGSWDESKKADYAILLGSADAEGRIEWCGTNLWDNAVSTRPLAVTGKGGRLVASGPDRRIGWKGAFAADEGGGTLVLDGDASTNYLYNVTDGHGTMSITKEGGGTWVLGGEQTFSGDLAVKDGELVVSSTLGTRYRWFRYTIKHTNCSDADSTTWSKGRVAVTELGIYDDAGNRLNRDLANAGDMKIPDPGQASVWRNSVSLNESGGGNRTDASRLFDDTNGSPNFSLWCGGGAPRTNIMERWIPVVMHLTNDTVNAASYDVCAEDGYSSVYTPTAWTMEASADGLFWDLVHEVTANAVAFGWHMWMSNNGYFGPNQKRTGFRFGLDNGKSLLSGAPDQLANAKVSVSEGAVLRAEGSVSIKSIAVDANGAGTIDGFSIAADGLLTVEGIRTFNTMVELPIALVNVAGVENFVSWKVSVGGRVYRQAMVKYLNGKLCIIPPGCLILIK